MRKQGKTRSEKVTFFKGTYRWRPAYDHALPISLQQHNTFYISHITSKRDACSQVAKGSDLYRADKSTKLCMVVA